MTPDTIVFTLAFSTLLRGRAALLPARAQPRARDAELGSLRKFGTVAASPENARKALDVRRRAARLPGRRLRGAPPELAAQRSTSAAARASSALALERDVPIVPVVSIGGQETALFLTRGERLARLLRLDRMFRLKVLPISIALPWGLNVGDMLGHIPLPAKITIETLPAIDLREEFGPDPDVDEIYDHLIAPDAGHARRAGRPSAACRCSDESRREHRDRGPARARYGRSSPTPSRMLELHVRRDPLGGRGSAANGARRAVPGLFRVGAAEIGGLIEVVEWDEGRDLAWTSVLGIDQRGRWRLRERPRTAAPGSSSGWPTASPARASAAGSQSGSPPRPSSGHLRRTPAAAQAPDRARAAARARGRSPRRSGRVGRRNKGFTPPRGAVAYYRRGEKSRIG